MSGNLQIAIQIRRTPRLLSPTEFVTILPMIRRLDELLKGLSESMRCLASSICENTSQRTIEFDWLRSHAGFATKHDLKEMEKNMAIKLSEIKTAIATATKANREAFTELGTKIADLQKQIDDLIAGVGDPEVTDEAFEADLKQLGEDAKALADIVPGSPTPTPPEG